MKNKTLISFSLIIILIDQIVKIIISTNLKMFKSIIIIPDFFKITYVKNTGAAFSIFNNATLFLIIMSFLALYLLYKYLIKNNKYTIESILLLGGIVANLIDRIFRGYVVDYLDFKILNYDFPIFNIADICIVIGCILLGIKFIKE